MKCFVKWKWGFKRWQWSLLGRIDVIFPSRQLPPKNALKPKFMETDIFVSLTKHFWQFKVIYMYVDTCTYTYINVKLNIKYAFSLVVFLSVCIWNWLIKLNICLTLNVFPKTVIKVNANDMVSCFLSPSSINRKLKMSSAGVSSAAV